MDELSQVGQTAGASSTPPQQVPGVFPAALAPQPDSWHDMGAELRTHPWPGPAMAAEGSQLRSRLSAHADPRLTPSPRPWGCESEAMAAAGMPLENGFEPAHQGLT